MNVHVVLTTHKHNENYEAMYYVFKQSAERFGLNVVRHDIPIRAHYNSHLFDTNLSKLEYQAEIEETEPYILSDCDGFFMGDVRRVFENEFDLCFTETGIQGRAPINAGVVFVRPNDRSKQFLRQWAIRAAAIRDEKDFVRRIEKHKGVCQGSLQDVLSMGIANTITVPSVEYNASPIHCRNRILPETKFIHLNSNKLRASLFNDDEINNYYIAKEFFKYKSIPLQGEIKRFQDRVGHIPNFDKPKTFNEKLGWKKHNDRNLLIVTTSDKVAVRDYVREKGFVNILAPILYVGDSPTYEDLNSGIMKANNASGRSLILRRSEAMLSMNKAKSWLKRTYGNKMGEWQYSCIKPQIIIEELLGNKPLPCVKAMCFHGKAEYFYYIEYGASLHPDNITMLDKDWVMTDAVMQGADKKQTEKPVQFDKINEICEKLSADFDFVRVDLMLHGDDIYFSELTHFPTCGMMKYTPESWDRKLGDLWKI